MRQAEALLLVIGDFENARLVLPGEIAEPAKQVQALRDDLLLFDMEAAETRLNRVEERIAKNAGDRAKLQREAEHLRDFQARLESGTCPSEGSRTRTSCGCSARCASSPTRRWSSS